MNFCRFLVFIKCLKLLSRCLLIHLLIKPDLFRLSSRINANFGFQYDCECNVQKIVWFFSSTLFKRTVTKIDLSQELQKYFLRIRMILKRLTSPIQLNWEMITQLPSEESSHRWMLVKIRIKIDLSWTLFLQLDSWQKFLTDLARFVDG